MDIDKSFIKKIEQLVNCIKAIVNVFLNTNKRNKLNNIFCTKIYLIKYLNSSLLEDNNVKTLKGK